MAFKISGTKVVTYIGLTLQEMEIEAMYLMEKSELEVKKLMVQNGVTRAVATQQIISVIANQEEFMKVWMNRNKRLIDEMHSQLVAQPVKVYGKKNKKKLFAWVLDARAKHCGDCLDMAEMEPMTIADWEMQGVGLPREGGTACNVGCKCNLEPV